MKQCGLIIAALCCLGQPVATQETSATARGTPWQQTARALWQVDLGYPIRASSGLTVMVGRTRRLTGYEGQLRGVLASVDAGLSGVSAKVGWADLRPYDAGMSGYSAEMVFVRPSGIGSRFDRDVNYVGPGLSYYLYYFRLSGAILFAPRSARNAVVPAATAALVVPLWR
jgi:hypothetical protein